MGPYRLRKPTRRICRTSRCRHRIFLSHGRTLMGTSSMDAMLGEQLEAWTIAEAQRDHRRWRPTAVALSDQSGVQGH